MYMDAESLFFQGTRDMASGDLASAEDCFRKALELNADFAEAYTNLGLVLAQQGKPVAAESCYRRSLQLDPSYFETHLNLGAFLSKQKRFEDAESTYGNAIALKPDSAAAWSNLGVLYACMKREAEAEQCYRTALFLDGSYAKARFNLSYVLLRQGRFDEGWGCLEARDWYAPLAAHLSCPRWQGEALCGSSILIGYEAGHGDMIQFFRYVAVLKAQGAVSVSMICHPALKTLFAAQKILDSVISFAEQIPKSGWDFWTPPLSIPYYCKLRLDSIPAQIPYLRVAPELIEKWVLPVKGLKVGIAWKGNPLFENDADRSIASLEVLAPLGRVTGINFISLQLDCTIKPPMQLINFADQITDFADTAALMMNLDLVISVDTAVAHLAGALGIPCWIMLPEYQTDWRWLKDRTDTPWYPNIMRLFRQTATGGWSLVVAELVEALEEVNRGQTPVFL
jgi:tetratricopeptide (TPR) repeat protein